MLVEDFGRLCRPPLRKDEVRAALRQGENGRVAPGRWLSNKRLADEFDINPFTEAPLLPRLAARLDSEATAKDSRIAKRRETIQSIIVELGLVPSLRDMETRLQARGEGANWTTIRRDYTALGQPTQSTNRGGRPLKLRQV